MLRRGKRKRGTDLTVEENDEWATFANLINETMSSIQLLLNQHIDGFVALGLPPLIVWHQLYTILANRTFVDQNVNRIRFTAIIARITVRCVTQVHRLRKSGKLITFKIPSGVDDVVILRIEDYISEVEKYEAAFRGQHPINKTITANLNAMAAFRRALPQLASLSTISLQVLISKMSESECCLDEQKARALVGQIQRLGFLLPTTRLDNESYSFSIPGVGKLVSAIKKTRTQVLNTLKRTKYKEVLEQQLKKVKLKHSCFKLEFHLADMEGCELIQTKKVTSGVLVALSGLLFLLGSM